MDGDATGSSPVVNIVVSEEVFLHHMEKVMSGDPGPVDPNDDRNRCETTAGVRIDPYEMLIAAGLGHVRRVVLDSKSVVIDMGRKQRLFIGRPRAAMGQRRPHQRQQRCPHLRAPQPVAQPQLPHLARPTRPLAPHTTRRHRNRLASRHTSAAAAGT